VTEPRRFSHAIAEGDGISVIAAVEDAEAARKAEAAGAEAILVHRPDALLAIREAVTLPVLVPRAARAVLPEGADACIADFGEDAAEDGESEVAWRVRDEEQLEEALERLDPELFVLAGTLEQVHDLLAEVPAGKLVLAELPSPTHEDVEELERAGVDAVIVHGRDLR
jgi:NAD(P)H-dependent flavin oxidoreductase YrpB (nitropropane dioxygenase family)